MENNDIDNLNSWQSLLIDKFHTLGGELSSIKQYFSNSLPELIETGMMDERDLRSLISAIQMESRIMTDGISKAEQDSIAFCEWLINNFLENKASNSELGKNKEFLLKKSLVQLSSQTRESMIEVEKANRELRINPKFTKKELIDMLIFTSNIFNMISKQIETLRTKINYTLESLSN